MSCWGAHFHGGFGTAGLTVGLFQLKCFCGSECDAGVSHTIILHCSSVSEKHRWAFTKLLFIPWCLISRYHDAALLRVRPHDILLSIWLKSTGNALLRYLSAVTNLIEMRWLSEKLHQRTEQTLHVPTALSPKANQIKADHWVSFTAKLLSSGASSSLQRDERALSVKRLAASQDRGLANRVTGPLPQTLEWQIGCSVFLTAAASCLCI